MALRMTSPLIDVCSANIISPQGIPKLINLTETLQDNHAKKQLKSAQEIQFNTNNLIYGFIAQ
jgi:hypothetical protein